MLLCGNLKQNGQTAIVHAACNGFHDICAYLLSKGASANAFSQVHVIKTFFFFFKDDLQTAT